MKSVLVFLIFLSSNIFGQDTISSSQFEMNGCINLYSSDSTIIIRDRESLDTYVRKDASSSRCKKHLKNLDLDIFSILGINLNSGYCRVPAGLTFDVVKIEDEKKYVILISYIEPLTPCRARSSYDLWIKAPSIPSTYEVEFVVTPLLYQE